jgi:hypothetical protein
MAMTVCSVLPAPLLVAYAWLKAIWLIAFAGPGSSGKVCATMIARRKIAKQNDTNL